MSALFHSYLCGRNAAEWLIKMEQKKIERINELARLAKERELTDEEKVERAALRQEYVNAVLGDLKNQLDNTYVMDEKGNKTKLTRWSEDRKLGK